MSCVLKAEQKYYNTTDHSPSESIVK